MEPQLILICFLCFAVQEGFGREEHGQPCPNCLEGPLAACVAVPIEMVEERSGDYIKAAALRAVKD
jgi:hypothetical protein